MQHFSQFVMDKMIKRPHLYICQPCAVQHLLQTVYRISFFCLSIFRTLSIQSKKTFAKWESQTIFHFPPWPPFQVASRCWSIMRFTTRKQCSFMYVFDLIRDTRKTVNPFSCLQSRWERANQGEWQYASMQWSQIGVVLSPNFIAGLESHFPPVDTKVVLISRKSHLICQP